MAYRQTLMPSVDPCAESERADRPQGNVLSPQATAVFYLLLIRPTHYDDDGYPIQWLRSQVPSGSLACLYGIALDCRARRVLGQGVDLRLVTIDETNRRVKPERWIGRFRREHARALVAFVGVQSNQFPRTLDLAQSFVAADIPVCVGGFHVTGCLAMLPTLPSELVDALAMGISLFAGEAEQGRLDEVLRDAYAGRRGKLYDYRSPRPDLSDQPVPVLPIDEITRTQSAFPCFDLGRGCPFHCSFCTIVNVHGRESRYRTADDLERIVRHHHALGVHSFFLTDDNFARNKNWEAFFDRLIAIREAEGWGVRLLMQVDMLSHRVPRFVDKAVRAGVDQLFVGLESIDPDSLRSIGKTQNRIQEYREMLLAWKKYPVVITGGYIIGFPNDTRESVLRNIAIIQKELPIDLLYFTNLTPLPGSQDHQRLWEQGVWMDPDLNKFDANHQVTRHPLMSDAEWAAVYREAWTTFYSFQHMDTILRRMVALRSNKKLTTVHRMTWFRDYLRLADVHGFDGGLFRLKFRRDRRPGLPTEPRVTFYASYAAMLARSLAGMTVTYCRLRWMLRRVWRDPAHYDYADEAIGEPRKWLARPQTPSPAPSARLEHA
ncbi:MAG: radical SAM protein [Polyangiaceae bacterium]|nr:radical SAM protein [Polyangiaceae bacterium]